MDKKEIAKLIYHKASLLIPQLPELDPGRLAVAIAITESSLNPFVSRYEKYYAWLVDVDRYARNLSITRDTEKMMQRTSWGLFQIMGAVARELGYNDYLHLLATQETIDTQIELFVRHFNRIFKHYNKDIARAISGYNAGFALKKPTNYYNKVIKNYKEAEKWLG
jgi:hypothetical protein